MKKYRVREGSLLDWLRLFGVAIVFYGLMFAATASEYPLY